MRELIWLYLFGAATVISAVWPRKWPRWYPLVGLGAVLGFAVVLYAYFSSSRNYDPFGCSECRQHLGRWWEPDFVLILVVMGYLVWCLGLVVGAGLRASVTLLRGRISADGA